MSEQKYVIVVGVDFSETSELAFERALEVAASKRHVELHAVNVQLPVTGAVPSASTYELSVQAARRALQDYVARSVGAFPTANGIGPVRTHHHPGTSRLSGPPIGAIRR